MLRQDALVPSLQARWLDLARVTDVGLWVLVESVREALPGASEEVVRQVTLGVLLPLLEDGRLRAFGLSGAGRVESWGGGASAVAARLDAAWRALGRPPGIGEVAWFSA